MNGSLLPLPVAPVADAEFDTMVAGFTGLADHPGLPKLVSIRGNIGGPAIAALPNADHISCVAG
jgi:hypothetical protein